MSDPGDASGSSPQVTPVWFSDPSAEPAELAPEQAREDALRAIHLAAHHWSVEPAALTMHDYRAYRSAQGDNTLPSALTISTLFSGWQRAREHLAGMPGQSAGA